MKHHQKPNRPNMEQQSLHLRVMLFCNGRGADPNGFQPNRDTSAWWNRRDALVRCVTAFLLGPSRQSDFRSVTRELILWFEQDGARMEMSYESVHQEDVGGEKKSSVRRPLLLPTEQVVIGLWKRACQQPGKRVEQSGLACRLVPLADRIAANETTKHSGGNMPVGTLSLDSKRGLLQHLQQVCSLEFLRQHGLNSSLAVLLRKTNLAKLQAIHREWNKLNQQGGEEGGEQTAELESSSMPLLEPVLQQVLQPARSGSTVLAATLHESGVEFPYWISYTQQQSTSGRNHVTVCLFLGAVRDLTRQEHTLLQDTCRGKSVFFVRVRLGRVPEFTSKILTVVAHHGSTWGPGLRHLQEQEKQQSPGVDTVVAVNRKRKLDSVDSSSKSPPRLNTICVVPASSQIVSSDLQDRNRLLWSLARVTVCSLWRSKWVGRHDLGGKDNQSDPLASTQPLINSLTVVFDDVVFRLVPTDFMAMAQEHKAAPTEHQILAFLQTRLQETSVAKSSWKEALDSSTALIHACRGRKASSTSLIDAFYDSEPGPPESTGVALLLSLENDAIVEYGKHQSSKFSERKMVETILHEAQSRGISVVESSVSSGSSCVDNVGGAVTLVQHALYQGRLGSML